ncbi:SDR family NAD(P)-dependent oxidoreductase [Paenibacillus radicis (ex Xue et al. 2023)]|uniref:SDR family NAD(P)-dependent oxidoreductase n=1 Tax=Paenibacillus radicis (ex Xue et al. 2023) TaxID=2972489 RepID=A0ABT1YA68_9BACL|nr:SDR family NAD(P)-dependent oxidoreductase [Paenibacillus radicis (ex Xue et al. 2023)]MCR8630085.1 SDR family NAD(P)-dependent oxidoreductase [Paenibacillus radicis (ex Xue et al. 2023)]
MTANRLTACISGTDRGIGLELVKHLLKEGYIVFAGGIIKDNESISQLAEQFPGQLHASILDVGSDASVKEFAAFIESKTDKLDLLINNAAILGETKQTVEDSIDFDDIQRVYNITAVGAIRLSNLLIRPVMNGGKLIVNISSEAGSIGNSYREAWFGYCMAKAALNMGSSIIHNKIRKQGGRVMLLHPGWVKTFMQGTWNDQGTYTPEEAASNIVKRIDEFKDQIRELPIYIEADTGKELPW